MRSEFMPKCKHRTLIFLSGALWTVIGIFLLSLGVHFLLETLKNPSLLEIPKKFSIVQFFSRFSADKNHAVILIVTLSLFMGYFKGKMALAKSVDRQLKRIFSLPNPASLKLLYGKGYYLLIATMILLGVSLRFLPITLDTRGAIDCVIGSALINGSMLFFRACSSYSSAKKEQ